MGRQFCQIRPVLSRETNGPIHAQIACFAKCLAERGYSNSSIDHRRRLITALDQWFVQSRIGLKDFNEGRIDQFLRDRRKQYSPQFADPPTLRCFLDHLRHAELVPPPASKRDNSPLAQLQANFAEYLAEERGLKQKTRDQYLAVTGSFLSDRFENRVILLNKLTPQDVAKFVISRARCISPTTAQHAATVLRNFLRFLYKRGDIHSDLRMSVPAVANWSLAPVPKYLPAAEVELLLEKNNQNSATGQRDHTILLLLARLGLRAGEVVHMTLDDIDWEAGELTIGGKGSRQERLPIPEDVGIALARYFHEIRPRCASRRVFIRMHAPHLGFKDSSSITGIVHGALNRAGLNPAHRGAHLLRHSLATRMLRGGASLTEIGKILRHQLTRSTAIYAKVDLTALRGLAQPWPGGKA